MRKEIIDNIFITFASDPLSQVTRRSRITLLIVSLIGFLIFNFGVDPHNFSLLGIRFNNFSQELFNKTLLIILIFLLIDFVVHVITDLFIRFNLVSEQKRNEELEAIPDLSMQHDSKISKAENDADKTQINLRYFWLDKNKKYLWVFVTIRIVLDTIIPLGFSAYVLLTFYV